MGPDSVSVAYISHYKPVLNRPFATELRWELLPLVSGTHSMADTVACVPWPTEGGGAEWIFEF